jgi:hypothetical protein
MNPLFVFFAMFTALCRRSWCCLAKVIDEKSFRSRALSEQTARAAYHHRGLIIPQVAGG